MTFDSPVERLAGSLRQRGDRVTRCCALAFVGLQPYLALDDILVFLPVLLLDHALGEHRSAGDIHAPVLDAQLLQRAPLADPIGHDLAEEGVLERPVQG